MESGAAKIAINGARRQSEFRATIEVEKGKMEFCRRFSLPSILPSGN